MNSKPNLESIRDIAREFGTRPAFIEKDWYSVQLLKLLSEFENDHGIELVFAGGTSLSKGFGLINRFSEDLDFLLWSPEPVTQGNLREFRKSVIAHITSNPLFTIEEDKDKSRNKSRYFQVQVQCGMVFKDKALRPYLLLEMTFSDHEPQASKQDVQSIVSKLASKKPETQMTCISPIETASDKISALTWRVVAKDKYPDDPTLVRHLHDLAALKSTIFENKELFVRRAGQALEHDREHRGGEVITNMSIPDRLVKAHEMLASDKEYRKEYEVFVGRMSYAGKNEKISFDAALAALKEIIDILV